MELPIASPVYEAPLTLATIAAGVLGDFQAEIEPSRLAKMKAALPAALPLVKLKSDVLVTSPAAEVLTWPVGPFSSPEGGAPFRFGTAGTRPMIAGFPVVPLTE